MFDVIVNFLIENLLFIFLSHQIIGFTDDNGMPTISEPNNVDFFSQATMHNDEVSFDGIHFVDEFEDQVRTEPSLFDTVHEDIANSKNVEEDIANSKNVEEDIANGKNVEEAVDKEDCGKCEFIKEENRYDQDYFEFEYGMLFCLSKNCKFPTKKMKEFIDTRSDRCFWVCKNCKRRENDTHGCMKMYCNTCYCSKEDTTTKEGERKRSRRIAAV